MSGAAVEGDREMKRPRKQSPVRRFMAMMVSELGTIGIVVWFEVSQGACFLRNGISPFPSKWRGTG
jgi:hypothetical protein